MNLTKYVRTSEDIRELASAGEIRAAKAILHAIRVKIGILFTSLKNSPADQTDEEIRHKLAQICALEWVLELPEQAKEILKNLPEGEEL
jgi:hypothetical protein